MTKRNAFLTDTWFQFGIALTALSVLALAAAWTLSSPVEASESLRNALIVPLIGSQIGLGLLFFAIFRVVYRALERVETPRKS